MAAKLKCSKCSRTFSMPAHLARHMNTIHRAGSARGKKRPVAKAKGKVGRPKGSGAKKVAARVAVGGVERLVGEMQTYLADVSAQRAALDAEVAAVTAAMKAIGAAVPRGRMVGAAPKKRGRPAGRGPRPGSLKSYITKVLGQRATSMSPNEIAVAVRKAGYQSDAKDLTKAVSNTLPDLKGVKKVGFGQYRV
ncbi:MAG: C2H2-type zinc finger protein [Phycisphaerales bacterium]|nr:MAG: C2H2-type zinc finger protein [Phycisphaerales bacterium]